MKWDNNSQGKYTQSVDYPLECAFKSACVLSKIACLTK